MNFSKILRTDLIWQDFSPGTRIQGLRAPDSWLRDHVRIPYLDPDLKIRDFQSHFVISPDETQKILRLWMRRMFSSGRSTLKIKKKNSFNSFLAGTVLNDQNFIRGQFSLEANFLLESSPFQKGGDQHNFSKRKSIWKLCIKGSKKKTYKKKSNNVRGFKGFCGRSWGERRSCTSMFNDVGLGQETKWCVIPGFKKYCLQMVSKLKCCARLLDDVALTFLADFHVAHSF